MQATKTTLHIEDWAHDNAALLAPFVLMLIIVIGAVAEHFRLFDLLPH